MKTGMIVVFASLMAMPAFAQDASAIKYHDGTTQLTVNAEEGTAEIDETCGSVSITGWNVDGTAMKAYEKGGLPSTAKPTEVTAHATQSGDEIILAIRGMQQMEFTPGAAPAHMNCLMREITATPAQAIEQSGDQAIQQGGNNDIMINATSWAAQGGFPALQINGKKATISESCSMISIADFHADGEPMVGEQGTGMMVQNPRPTKVTVTAHQQNGRMDITIDGTPYSLSPGKGGGMICEAMTAK